jgi:hypothetical protein
MTTENTTTTSVPASAVPAVAVPAVLEDVTGYTQMSSAFDELVAPSTTPAKPQDTVTSPPALDAAAQATKDAAAAAVADTPAPAAVTGSMEVPAAGTSDEAATAAAATAATDWKTEYEKLLAAQKAVPAPAESEPVQSAVTAVVTPPALYTADEQAAIAEYQKDWPGVSQGERLIRRAEYSSLVAHIFNEVKRVYDPLVQRALVTADNFESTTMVGEIRKAHADYTDALHDEVVAWAGTLKGMRRAVAEKIIEEGEPQEVVDLISEFKQATGKTVTPAAVTVKLAAGSNVTDISEAAKKAAKAMGVVEGKRTAANTAEDDPNDFDGTWAKLMADVK